MKLFVGFHDSTLDKILYEEEYGKSQLKVIFDNSGWYGIVELCFEGHVRMHLHNYGEKYTREIYSAALFVQDENVFWADDILDEEKYFLSITLNEGDEYPLTGVLTEVLDDEVTVQIYSSYGIKNGFSHLKKDAIYQIFVDGLPEQNVSLISQNPLD